MRILPNRGGCHPHSRGNHLAGQSVGLAAVLVHGQVAHPNFGHHDLIHHDRDSELTRDLRYSRPPRRRCYADIICLPVLDIGLPVRVVDCIQVPRAVTTNAQD